MSDERKESLFIKSFSGRDTADQAYETLRQLEKDKQLDIRTAMTITREDNGKLKLKHRRRLTVGKGMFAGGGVGLLLFGPGAILGGMAIGALAGASRSGDRAAVKRFLEDKLGPDDSALAILIKEANWAAVIEKMDPYVGDHLVAELSSADKAAIEALGDDEEVVVAVEEQVEVVDDDDVEVIE